MTDTLLRPRSLTEIIDAAFHIYRSAFLVMIPISAGFNAIVFAFIIALSMTGEDPTAVIILAVLFVPIVLVAATFMEGAVAAATGDVVLGRQPTIVGSLRQVADRFGSVLGALFYKYMLLGFAFIAPVLAGMILGPVGSAIGVIAALILVIWMWCSLFAIPIVTLAEKASAGDSVDRSRALSSGRRWRIFGAIAVAVLIVMLLAFGAMVLIVPLIFSDQAILAQVVNAIVSLITYPFIPIVATLLYFDARIRKEGFDIEHLASAIDAPRPVGA